MPVHATGGNRFNANPKSEKIAGEIELQGYRVMLYFYRVMLYFYFLNFVGFKVNCSLSAKIRAHL